MSVVSNNAFHLFVSSLLGGHEPKRGTKSPSTWKRPEHQTWNGCPVHLSHCKICKWENKSKLSLVFFFFYFYLTPYGRKSTEMSGLKTVTALITILQDECTLMHCSGLLCHHFLLTFSSTTSLHSSCLKPTTLIAVLIIFPHCFA